MIILLLIFLNALAPAMDCHTDKRTKRAINNRCDDSQSDELCTKDTLSHLLNTQENTNPPPWQKKTEKIEKLNHKVLTTHAKMTGGITQPFKTWFGMLNYLHDTKKVKNFLCPVCKTEFTRATSAGTCFLRHFDSRIFSCESCKTHLSSYLSYVKHTTCPEPYCDPQSQPAQSVLMPALADERFLRDIVNQKMAVITCCGSFLGNWSTALNHSSRMHKVGRSYQCNGCFNKYQSNTQALECYVNHCDESIFACPICNKAYVTRETLLHHACNPEKIITHETFLEFGPCAPLTRDRIYSSHQSDAGLLQYANHDYSYYDSETSSNVNTSYKGSFDDHQSQDGLITLQDQRYGANFYVWPHNSQEESIIGPPYLGLSTPAPNATQEYFWQQESSQYATDNRDASMIQPSVTHQTSYDFDQYYTV